MKNFLLFLLLACLGLPAAQAQMPNNAKMENYRWSNYRVIKGEKVLQAQFTGKDAKTVSGGEALVTQFEMRTFRNGDPKQVQIIAKTPESFFNPDTHTAHSTNFIQAYTASTNFYIEGRGFFCTQSNAILIISNNVETRFRKTLLKSSSLSAATASADTNDLVKILSDHFEVQWESNLVIYTGNVRVIDPQMQLNCDLLVGRFNTNNFRTNAGIEQITAEHNVVILTANKGRATGEKAVYVATPGAETIVLTDHATWSDGQREAQANQFTFDRKSNLLQADGAVDIKFPNGTTSRTNLASNPLLAASAAPSTNGLTELSAGHVTVQLSPTNGPPLSFLAENNVVITNRSELSRATGQRAFYTATNEEITLTGDPIFQSSKGELRGRLLSFAGRTNQVVKSIGDSHLTLNLAGRGLAGAAKSNSKKPIGTNTVLEVASDTLEYSSNTVTFTKDVHAQALQDTNLQATLDCQLLNLYMGTNNQVKTVSARGQVRASQPPTGQIEKRTLACNALTINFWPGTEYLRNALVEGDVQAEQIGPALRKVKINASIATALFAASSNLLEHAEAQTNVHGEQDEGKGKLTQFSGQHVVYTLNTTNEPVQITGSPEVRYWMGSEALHKTKTNSKMEAPAGVLLSGADELLWDPQTKNFKASGPYSVVPIPAQTNAIDVN